MSSDILNLLKERIDSHGSELGLAAHLYAMVIAIRASSVVEIGRFKGFSTTALAAGLAFNAGGWEEPEHHQQRPDVDYTTFGKEPMHRLVSIDPKPRPEAKAMLLEAGLMNYVEMVNARSDDYQPKRDIDLLFIDGDHTELQTRRDFDRFSPFVREHGLIVIHDIFGYYLPDGGHIRADGKHVNPVHRAVRNIVADYNMEPLLIDTGYMSHVVFTIPKKQEAK